MRTRHTATVVALALAAAVGGCGADADQPTRTSAGTSTSSAATPTPSVDPDDPQAVAYDIATRLFEEYFALSQEIRQEPGLPNWRRTRGYTTGDFNMVNIATYEAMIENEEVQHGEARIASIAPTSYQEYPDRGGYDITAKVTLAVCVDSSESSIPGWRGGPTRFKPDQPDRVLLTYTVIQTQQPHAGDDAWVWTIDSAEIMEGQSC